MHYVWSGQLLKCTSRCVSTNSAIVMMATAVSPKFKQELREKLESFRFKIFCGRECVCMCVSALLGICCQRFSQIMTSIMPVFSLSECRLCR